MTSAFRIPSAPLNRRSWLGYPAGQQSRGRADLCELDLCELPLARRRTASQTAPEVAARA